VGWARPRRVVALFLHSAPWAYFCGDPGVELCQGDTLAVNTKTAPRLRGTIPRHGRWNGSRPVLASAGNAEYPDQWDLPYPISSGKHLTHVYRGLGVDLSVQIEGLPPRAQEQDREDDPRERWLLWQVQRYNELASLERTHGKASSIEAAYRGGVRRSWHRVSQLWQEGGEETAELSLIVRLARKTALVFALRAIERNPRNMLLRKHKPQKISHIQEMDATTLRAYSRAPGRTAVQKAGPKQELLAVIREDTADLPENRVLIWTMLRMQQMAKAYCARNIRHSGSERYKSVQTIQKLTQKILASPRLKEVRALPHHLNTPTYCLQFESRYRHVWKTYLEIRRQERALDDSWRWHSHLWGTTSRLLLTSLLMELPEWEEKRNSTPYFLKEGIGGEWTAGPSTPGPFLSPFGECYVVEMRSRNAAGQIQQMGIPMEVFSSGAEWVLCWPNVKKICLMWSAITRQAGKPIPLDERLQRKLHEQSQTSRWSWWGWVLLAEPGTIGDDSKWVDSNHRLTVLRVPSKVHKHWGDLRAGLELALEAMNEI
jgi:uncharacterized protein DUF2357